MFTIPSANKHSVRCFALSIFTPLYSVLPITKRQAPPGFNISTTLWTVDCMSM